MSTSGRGSILLADDEEGIRKTLGRALGQEGYEVVTTASGSEAQRLLSDRSFDVVVVDHRMPGRTGLELVRDLATGVPPTERPQVVMMTAHATVENAIEAMKLGAYDYLQKPFEVEELLVVVRRAREEQILRRQHSYLLSEREEEFGSYGIVGRSRGVQEVIRKLELVARSKSTVLITGETGTGKELAARAIHARSEQREQPLIKVSCAAIPETLIESELFGHVKGAFTGATANRRGRFALADGGSIFLDEIGTLGAAVQAKLLRVLQEREFEPVGSERTQSVDLRVIAATNRDLRAMVAEGRFLEDLYYRLSVIPIELPPLRERREDIPLLAEHFLRKHAQRLGRRIDGLAPGILDRLTSYHWPGNVRELENTIERAVVLAAGATIDAAAVSLVAPPTGPSQSGPPSQRLRENVEWAERESVRRALETAGGVKKEAAETLGISQRALSYYLAKYRVE
jgi:two-component system response regulator AtoC